MAIRVWPDRCIFKVNLCVCSAIILAFVNQFDVFFLLESQSVEYLSISREYSTSKRSIVFKSLHLQKIIYLLIAYLIEIHLTFQTNVFG